MLFNSPFVTVPAGASRGSSGPRSMSDIARDAARLDDPVARDLVGEASMLDIVRRELEQRLATGIAGGAMSSQAAAIGRLFAGVVGARMASIAFELAGSAGGAWADDDGALVDRGTDFLMRQTSCIGGGTTEMARNVISERVLGMPREAALDRDVAFRDVPRRRPDGA
jgi:alkylation response protein AidB-like acyl-CoA dehydrogenase